MEEGELALVEEMLVPTQLKEWLITEQNAINTRVTDLRTLFETLENLKKVTSDLETLNI